MDWPRATVEFTFFCDGVTITRAASPPKAPIPSLRRALLGTDADHPQKTYEIFDVRSDGKATGTSSCTSELSNTTTHDELEAIDLAAAGDRLVFDFISTSTVGPIHYDLQREP